MNRVALSWLLFVAVSLAVIVFLRRSHPDAARLARDRQRGEVMQGEVARLWRINRALQLRQIPTTELRQLEADADEARTLRRRLGALRLAASGTSAAALRYADSAAIPATEWGDAGQATPRETMISILWAASHGETDRLAKLIALSGEARVKAQGIFDRLSPDSQRDYGSTEQVVATLIAGKFPSDASAASFNGGAEAGGAASLSVSIDHAGLGTRTSVYTFGRRGADWCLEVPPAVLAGLEAALQEVQVPVAPSAP